MIEKIEPGKYVELGYDLYAVEPDGKETLVHQTDKDDPEKVIFGITKGMIVPLEKAIEGLGVGAKFDVVANADEAFGPYDPEQVVELDRDIFIVDGEFDAEMIKPGNHVPMMTADGFRINGLVKEVTPEKVIMDFNHPLAGKSVRFDGTILAVRPATPEELQPVHSCCGGGCDHDHDHEDEHPKGGCCGGNGGGCGCH